MCAFVPPEAQHSAPLCLPTRTRAAALPDRPQECTSTAGCKAQFPKACGDDIVNADEECDQSGNNGLDDPCTKECKNILYLPP